MKNKVQKFFQTKLKSGIAFLLAVLMVLPSIPATAYQADDTLYNEATMKKDKTSIHVNLKDIGIPVNCDITRKTLASTYGGSDSEVAFCLDCRKASKDNVRYARTSEVADSTYVRIMNYCLSDSRFRGLFMTPKGEWSDETYAFAQAVIWGYAEKGKNVTEIAKVVDIVLTETSITWQNLSSSSQDKIAKEFTEAALDYSDNLGAEVYIWTADSGVQRALSVQKGVKPIVRTDDVERTEKYTAKEEIFLNILKTDSKTNKPLAGVKFEIYRDGVKVATKATDANGKISHPFSDSLEKEATSSKFLWCTNFNELSYPNQQNILKQGIFATEAEAINAAIADATAKAKTEAEKIFAEKHTYKAVEVATRDEYYLKPSTSQSITYASGDGSGSISFSFTNIRQYGNITLEKLDKDTKTPVAGAVYGLYAAEDIVHPDGQTGVLYKKDVLVNKFPATGANGKATITGLYLGKYYIKEISAPNGYILSEEVYSVELKCAGQNVQVSNTNIVVEDSSVRGTINVSKLDKDNADNIAQGDATLEGALYGLYAKEDIVYAGNASGVMHYNSVAGDLNEIRSSKGVGLVVYNVDAKAGTLLATIKTDKNGEFNFENLQRGNYDIKEISASEGYLLDGTKYDVVLEHDGKSKEIVVDVDVYEQVKKQAFDLYKVGQAEGTTTLKPLSGIEFVVKLESDVQELGWDAAPVYDVITTDVDGTSSSVELPYGTYRVKEINTPSNYISAADFFVEIKEDSREHLSYTNNIIINKEFSAILKIIKKDAETGKIVALEGAEFKVKALTDVTVNGNEFKAGEYIGIYSYNIANGWYQTSWTTDNRGMIVLNKLGAGTYQLEETKAPNGYLIDTTPIRFEVSGNSIYDISSDGKTPIITLSKTDIPVEGQITVEKRGEVLIGFEDGKFIYEERALEGAEFEVRAKENIMDPSNDGTVLYEQGALIEKIITGKDGKATSNKLPLGVYEVFETKAPEGMVLNNENKTVELKYADQNTAVVFEFTTVTNDRQKVNIKAIKKDSETDEFLDGAEITLYAKEDIISADGTVLVKAGDIVRTAISNDKGIADFGDDFPLASYYAMETKAPEGYASTDVTVELDASYKDQDIKIIELTATFVNEPIVIEVSKQDITTGEHVIGAELSIYPADEEGNPILGKCWATWITGEEPYYTERIPVGTYVLREVLGNASELGYVTAKDVIFVVSDTGEIQKVEMKDDYTKLEISKTDITTGEPVIGAELSIYPADEESNPILGECWATWITGEEPYYTERIPVGTYVLREVIGNASELGYVTAKDVIFVVSDTSEIQKVEMIDGFTTVKINKVDSDGNPVIGAVLSLVPMDEEGNPKYGEVFATWITGEEPYVIERLPIGKYLLVEQTAPEGLCVADPVVIEITDTELVQEFTMVDEFILTDIEVNKVDAKTGKPIVSNSFKFALYSDKECTVLVSGGIYDYAKGKVIFEGLKYGTYYLKEIEAPKDYRLSSEVIEITINDELDGVGDKLSFSYENESTIKNTGDTYTYLYSSFISIMGLIFIGFAVCKKRKVVI